MIKTLKNLSSSKFYSSSFFNKNIYSFSSASDPYYILGVQKTADFKEIKKCFFKLANEYHPDKNDTADARKRFLIVKQAFEQIKIEKGLMKPQNFVDSTSHDTVRPNANQFTPDQEEGFKSSRDYRIFREKAGSDERYSQFNSSFKTIHDINDIKIKVQEGQMRDASSRLNLESLRAKITVRPQSSATIGVIVIAGIFIVLAFINQTYSGIEQNINKKDVIKHSQFAKQKDIMSEQEAKQKSRIQRQKKLNHEELVKIINQTSEKKQNKNSQSKRIAWSKLIQNTKQQFLSPNQKVI